MSTTLGSSSGGPTPGLVGTPAYMAPELLRGGSATEASDQFAFGVTAYELLAGRRPHQGRSLAELGRALEAGTVARMRGVPGWLDRAVRTCLAVDPARRHPSMAEVARALEEGARRRRPVWIAGATAAAIAASALTFATVGGPTCNTDEIDATWNAETRAALPLDAPSLAAIDRWTASWRASQTEVCLAASAEPPPRVAARERCLHQRRRELQALIARIGATSADDDPRERLVDALAALPPSECTRLPLGAADPLPLDPEQRAEVDAIVDALPAVRAAIALGDARPVAATLDELVVRARASGHAPTLADVLLLQAQAWRAQSNLSEAATTARDAAAAAERGHDDLAAARAWLERTALASDRRDLAAADDLAAMTSAAIDRAGAPPPLVARLARIRGIVAFDRGGLDEARTLLLEARAGFVAIAGETSVEVAGVETSLGAVARVAGDLDAAERHHQRAFDIDRALRGASHPDLARDLHNLAGIARLRGDLDGALALYGRALAIEVAARGETSVAAALTRNSIGLVHMARGESAQAAAEVTFARDVFLAAGHGDLALAEHNLGLIRAATGDHASALAQFDAAAADYARTIGTAASAPTRLRLDRARSQALAAEPAPPADAPAVPAVEPPAPPVPNGRKGRQPREVGVYGSNQGG